MVCEIVFYYNYTLIFRTYVSEIIDKKIIFNTCQNATSVLVITK